MSGEGKIVGRQLDGAQTLARLNALGTSGMAVADDVFAIKGSADATKLARFEVDGLTTATTRTYTLPNANVVVAGSAAALTSGRVPYATTGGLLLDSALMTFDPTAASPKLSVGDGLGASRVTLNGAAGNNRQFNFETAGLARWIYQVTSTAEAGANSGSNFSILARDDAGNAIDTPLSIVRAAGGAMTVTRIVAITNTTAATAGGAGALTVAGGSYTAGDARVAGVFYLGTDTSGAGGFVFNSAAANTRDVAFRTAGVNRWWMRVNATAESGSDAGSNLEITARTDAGGAIDNPISIVRAAGGAITMVRPVTLSTTSDGLTISKTSGATLTVASTTDASALGTAATVMSGGLSVAKVILAGTGLAVGGVVGQTFIGIGTSFVPALQTNGTSNELASVGASRWAANTNGPRWFLGKSRGAAVGTFTIVQNGDRLGSICFNGANGTAFDEAARIDCEVDGTPGASADMPGRLMFMLSADSSATPAETCRITATAINLASGKVLQVNSAQVVGARKTGWAVASGTATRTTFDTATVTLPQLAERMKALIDDLHQTAGHGMIGT